MIVRHVDWLPTGVSLAEHHERGELSDDFESALGVAFKIFEISCPKASVLKNIIVCASNFVQPSLAQTSNLSFNTRAGLEQKLFK